MNVFRSQINERVHLAKGLFDGNRRGEGWMNGRIRGKWRNNCMNQSSAGGEEREGIGGEGRGRRPAWP